MKVKDLNGIKCTVTTVNCGDPEPPVNGSVDTPPHTREGASVMYRCNDGFRPSADFPSTCTNTAMWYPPPQDHNCTYVEGIQLNSRGDFYFD